MTGRPLRSRSARMARLMKAYLAKRKAFLEANPSCARCGQRAEELHHMAGRVGDLLLCEDNFLAVCHGCHVWITEHPREAVEQGFSRLRIGREVAS